MSKSFWGRSEPSQTKPSGTNALSPASPSLTPTGLSSFKTNVNRQKSKRWVEAKSYSYDGDDWGEVDDYDEYGAQPSVSASASKPTGLRQKGQGLASATRSGSGSIHHSADAAGHAASAPSTLPQSGNAGYRYSFAPEGEMTASPQEAQVHPPQRSWDVRQTSPAPGGQADRASTFPGYAHPGPPGVTYQGFQRSDEQPILQRPPSLKLHTGRQNDEGGSLPQGQRSPPIHRSSIQSPSRLSRQPPDPSLDQPTQQVGFGTSPSSPRDALGDAPSTVAPWYQPASPVTEASRRTSAGGSFPPRKSSLTHANPVGSDVLATVAPTAQQAMPSPTGPPTSPTALCEREPTSPQKPLPFIRPADIYKRIDEERAKERGSFDSDRRSMDSVRSRVPDAESPMRAKSAEERRSFDSVGRSSEGESHRRNVYRLDPVKERKSEYGLDIGTLDNEANPANAEDAAEPPPPDHSISSYANPASVSQGPATLASDGSNPSFLKSSPTLPDVTRVSGFGENFWPASEPTASGPPGSVETDLQVAPAPLQRQPSDEFRSVVDHAFELSEKRSKPPAPSSSDAGRSPTSSSEPKQSESGSPISPIMSQLPPAATFEDRLDKALPTPAEGGVTVAGGNDHVELTPRYMQKQDTSITSSPDTSGAAPSRQARRPESVDSLPPTTPGHRRNLSTPSPNNSPARSPVVEVSTNLPDGEPVELATVTPVDQGKLSRDTHPDQPPESRRTSDEEESGPRVAMGRHRPTSQRGDDSEHDADQHALRGSRPPSLDPPLGRTSIGSSSTGVRQFNSHVSRAGSPTKGKVRDLAGKFEKQGSANVPTSVRPGSSGHSDSSKEQEDRGLQRPRPQPSGPSFRPVLPGGWISYNTVDGDSTPATTQDDVSPQPEHLSEGPNPSSSATERSDDVIPAGMGHAAEDALHDSISNDPSGSAPHVQDERARDTEERQADTPSATADVGDFFPGPLLAAKKLEKENEEPEMTSQISPSPDIPPTPPPKDVTSAENPHSDPTHFTSPLTPRKRDGSPDVITPARKIESAKTSAVQVTSTNSSPSDQESDELRREIVRSLDSPTLSATINFKQPDIQHPDYLQHAMEPLSSNPARESTIFPSEYDSYWASTREAEQPEPPHDPAGGHQEEQEGHGGIHEARHSITSNPESSEAGQEHPSALEQHAPVENKQRPIIDQNSFCPEQGLASTDIAEEPTASADNRVGTPHSGELESSRLLPSSFSKSEPTPQTGTESQARSGEHSPAASTSDISEEAHSAAHPAEGHGSPEDDRKASPSSANEKTREYSWENGPRENQPVQTDSSGGLYLKTINHQIPLTESNPIHPEEQDVPLKNSDELSGSVRATEMRQVPEDHDVAASVLETQSHKVPIPAPAGLARVPTTQEIFAMKTAAERIKAYNAVRAHFASLDTGLVSWLETKTSINPSHKAAAAPRGPRPIVDTSTVPGPSSTSPPGQHIPARSSPTGTTSPGQPYYQQYLNFSDHSPSAQTASGSLLKAPPGASAGASQSSLSSAGRVSTGQVQAKGKELLHSAGVLGGKANVAAKGLFAKGKSRWRASASDKVDH